MKKPLILVVDDAPDLLALIAKVLSDDYEVRTAASGAQALIAAATEPQPVVILLDVEMEGITGFDTCKALKTNPATASIPVIFITGKGERQNEMLGLSLGAVFLLFALIRRGAATAVASLIYLCPPVTAVLAWLAFGEAYTVWAAAGMAIAAAGVWLAVKP